MELRQKRLSAPTTRRRGAYYVYLVRCRDGTYYAGATNDLQQRLMAHNAGRGAKYVRGRRPVRLVYVSAHRDYQSALRAEHALKTLTRKAKKALVAMSG